MGRISNLALGIVTAVGGFVDMGELVTCSRAGAQYGFALLWTIVVGVLSIMVYVDTAGRVAIASGRIIGLTGVDPIKLTIYTTALAAFSLPFTFIPLFIIANDEVYMGDTVKVG